MFIINYHPGYCVISDRKQPLWLSNPSVLEIEVFKSLFTFAAAYVCSCKKEEKEGILREKSVIEIAADR